MGAAALNLLLGDLGRDARKVFYSLALAVLIALAYAISSFVAVVGTVLPGGTITDAQTQEIPQDQLAAIQSAASACGLPWQALAAIAKVESNFGQNMATSSAGAIGYGQFLPSTWQEYGAGGNPYDYHDALPAMARYLCANGGAAKLNDAIFAYNHADWYVAEVMAVATRYGYLPPGGPPSEVVSLADAELGRPYVWGGSNPLTSFDCSGLVQWAYEQLGIALPRTAQEQWQTTVRLTPDQLQAGDLVFFSGTYDSPDPISHVGIYVGRGRMISAASGGVAEADVFDGYWLAHYAGAGRVRAGA